jgi:16S rRNA (guanine527-N7)-methyltransferase
LDSASILSEFNFNSEEQIIDVGTGAGFPGMVMKLFLPKNSFTLLDSTLKKIKFLQLLSARLGIYQGIEAIHDRAEDLAKSEKYRANFSHVVTRAVAPLKVLLEYTVPFAEKEGYINCFKGPNYNEEIKECQKAINILGVEITSIQEVDIPYFQAERYLIRFKKVKNTHKKYPRRTGVPKKRPL